MDYEQIPVRAENIITQDVDGEALILNNHGAEIHQLNDVASVIWNYCDSKHSIADIIHIILNNYAVSEKQASDDVNAVISELQDKGLIG